MGKNFSLYCSNFWKVIKFLVKISFKCCFGLAFFVCSIIFLYSIIVVNNQYFSTGNESLQNVYIIVIDLNILTLEMTPNFLKLPWIIKIQKLRIDLVLLQSFFYFVTLTSIYLQLRGASLSSKLSVQNYRETFLTLTLS